MARIRTIKPEFFTSADICDLAPLTRLFYISLWCEADREGLLVWNEKTLKLRYFPADDKKSFQASIDQLNDTDLIEIYEVDGKQYCSITAFKTHQVINNRESESKIPPKATNNDATSTRESGVQGEGKGKEGKGKEGNTRKTRKTNLPQDFSITDQMKEFYTSKGYPLNIERATDKWLTYIKSTGSQYVDWYAAWQGGVAKQNEWFVRDGASRGLKVVGGNHDDRGII